MDKPKKAALQQAIKDIDVFLPMVAPLKGLMRDMKFSPQNAYHKLAMELKKIKPMIQAIQADLEVVSEPATKKERKKEWKPLFANLGQLADWVNMTAEEMVEKKPYKKITRALNEIEGQLDRVMKKCNAWMR